MYFDLLIYLNLTVLLTSLSCNYFHSFFLLVFAIHYLNNFNYLYLLNNLYTIYNNNKLIFLNLLLLIIN
jgi:hypothetical protein